MHIAHTPAQFTPAQSTPVSFYLNESNDIDTLPKSGLQSLAEMAHPGCGIHHRIVHIRLVRI
jgi:hypothetical protein